MIEKNTLIIVSVSGGKDSTALYCWAIRQFGKNGFMAIFADTGHEHAVTYNYVRNLPELAGGPPIQWVKANFIEAIARKNARRALVGLPPLEHTGIPFLDMMLWKGRAPSTKAQFCTEHLKLIPIREWLGLTRADNEIEMYLGIRAAESEKRASMPSSEFSDFYDGYVKRPLIAWTEEEVFGYLRQCGVPPNPLYGLGYGRVGCFPCIHASKGELSLLPDWAWDKLHEWEQKVGRTWFPPGLVPGIHIPTIPEVRAWCITSRGGRQQQLFPPDQKDVPSCMSTWGMCE